MKVYTMVCINMDTGIVTDEDSFEYSGSVAECKGGGGSDSVDEEYNARMAAIAEEQQTMAQEYYDWYKSDYRPMEEAQIAANMGLIPQETALQSGQIASASSLLPYQTQAQQSQYALDSSKNEAALNLLPQQTQVASQFYNEAMNGVDINDRADQAQADVASAFAGTMESANRELSRMGVNPNSGAFAARKKNDSLAQARATGGARTNARTHAEQENFGRLQSAFGRY